MPALLDRPQKSQLLLTALDYASLPEGGPRYQLVQGNLLMAPSPSFDHQSSSVSLLFFLHGHVRQHKLGVVLAAPMDVHLDKHNVYQPDLIFISNARRGIIGEKFIKGAPDLVIEILSPSTRRLDESVKRKT